MSVSRLTLLALATGALALGAALPSQAASTAPASEVYVAHLHPLNAKVSGHSTHGIARFTIKGDTLKIFVDVHGASPDTVHWQHFHGQTNGSPAACATMAADANHDGAVDVTETGKASGTTMVPFDTEPAAMDVAHGTYPKADAYGNYHYSVTVPLKALEAAFVKAFPGQTLDLSKRVVYIHGVAADAKLPASVASLGPIPAQVTLPIACGRIERVTTK